MKVFYDHEGRLTKEEELNIKNESNVYYSEEHGAYLMSDKVLDYIEDKYHIRDEKRVDGYVVQITVFDSFAEWFDCNYEQESIEFLEKNFYYYRYADEVSEFVNNMEDLENGTISLTEDDWFCCIDKIVKTEILKAIMNEIKEELESFESQGIEIDYSILTQ